MTGILPNNYNYIGAFYGTPSGNTPAVSEPGKAVVNPGESTTVSPGRKIFARRMRNLQQPKVSGRFRRNGFL